MPLQYDPKWAELAAPLLRKHAGLGKAALHDVKTRRARIEAIFNRGEEVQLPEDIERIVHHARAGDNHEIAIYQVRKRNAPATLKSPAIVHIHGGGYFSCSAASSAAALAMYVSRTGVQMLSIEYRLAPENPFPVPLEDCWSALLWIQSQAEALEIDPMRLAVMGESAGGGLAAGLTLLARDRGLSPPLAKQILIFPMLNDRTQTDHTGGLAYWDVDDNITGWTAYLGDDVGTDKVTPYAAPARASSVEGLPPLYLDCPQLDILVHENVEYVQRFLKANISTEFHLYKGLPHGFVGLAPTSAAAQRAIAIRVSAMTDF
jgi:acetyl esterase/lipase